jgi:hypothetical protein
VSAADHDWEAGRRAPYGGGSLWECRHCGSKVWAADHQTPEETAERAGIRPCDEVQVAQVMES